MGHVLLVMHFSQLKTFNDHIHLVSVVLTWKSPDQTRHTGTAASCSTLKTPETKELIRLFIFTVCVFTKDDKLVSRHG